ncbi:hypothetical protein, partial [Enterococcus casseliflavus]|uniref:hypothetical protein n=1 Tax=Enterococcus casseliflavus TaxID=37734 RepID=UPI003D0F4C19
GAFALGLAEETAQVQLITSGGRRVLDLVPAGARGVRFSPSARAALVLYEDRAVVLNTPLDSATVAWEFAASANAVLSVSDD